MKTPNKKIAFKVLIGYTILGVLAVISGILLFSEIKTFTKLQDLEVMGRNNIIKTSSFITDIYENENLGRAAIQLNSTKRFNEYVLENKLLLKKIDSLDFFVKEDSEKFILDSIKLVLNKKRENITSLKRLNRQNITDVSINEAINKLGAIDSLLTEASIKDFVENTEFFDKQTRQSLGEYLRLLDRFENTSPVSNEDQKYIDSLVSVSKKILQKVQRDITTKRSTLRVKERELIENDLTISRKLREMLGVLENDVLIYANTIHKQNEAALERSKKIILLGGGISFVIIVFFSVIIINDFWKNQHFRQQLEKANATTSSLLKSREQLISMVSHDLRTPLSTVIGYSELLQNRIKAVKEKNYVTHIQEASVFMKQLVGDLLEFSKLEGGKTTIEKVPFDIKKHLVEVAESAKNLVKDKPILVQVFHDQKINSLIVGDPFRIRQILNNLVTNACKFTKEGSITIQSILLEKKQKKYVEIIVSDTGIGIEKNDQKNVFKAFTQANAFENKKNGFGLGLTISNRLAKLLGGKLTLKSSLGKGSVFTLQLPVVFSNTTIQNSELVIADSVFNIKAVVVEDDESMRKLLKNILEQFGVEVILFSNAHDVLENLSQINYDLVLTDIQLPKMNGLHFMETLKKHDSYNNQPIVAMTGRANVSEKEYIKSGFSDVLLKPFHPNKLKGVLQCFFYVENEKNKLFIQAIKPNTTTSFNLASIAMFLNNDKLAIKNMLYQFLRDTQQNLLLLEEAKQKNDLVAFNSLSHKMLSMFKQLEATNVVAFLELFEVSKTINVRLYVNFKKATAVVIKEIEAYLN